MSVNFIIIIIIIIIINVVVIGERVKRVRHFQV